MYKSNVYTGQEAKDHLVIGVNLVADAVKTTLGSKGSNAVLQEDVYPYHMVTNDGISIAQKIFTEHPVKQIGVNIMKEVADRANKESGDGTTTSITVAQAIIKEGQLTQENGIEVMHSLNACLPIIEASLEAQRKLITEDEVATVATISAEDESLGLMLQDIYKAIGKDGIIELDNSGTFDTTWSLTDGVRLRNAGFMSHYMANDGARAVYKNPRILITKQRISTIADIDPLFQQLTSKGINEVVIFADEIDPSVTAALSYTHVNGIFKTLIIKAPVLWKDWLYQDFAKITGANIVEPASGITLQTVSINDLGTCEKITTTKQDTIVVGIKDISEHIKLLEEEGTDDAKLRLAWLKTKAATLKVGGNSESELSYRRLKAEDARNASFLALQSGIVPGGGVALVVAAQKLPDTLGGRILKKALYAPLKQIIVNAGGTFDESIDWGFENKGYDSKHREVVDMWKAGIVDPMRVTMNSIKNAVSVAGVVLTAGVIVTNKNV